MADSQFLSLLKNFGGTAQAGSPAAVESEAGLLRLWRGFMAARILVALVLVMTLFFLRVMGAAPHVWAMAIALAYLALAVWMRVMGKPISQQLASPSSLRQRVKFDPQWLFTVGADVWVFAALLYLQVGGVNFTALFALPVLMAAVLGSLLLALGTAAVATIVLLADALQFSFAGALDAGPRYVQAALTGTGLFAVAYLTNQLAARLIRQERAAQSSEMAARTQIRVNQLIIDALSDGVLVIDRNGIVHAANPAAREILGLHDQQRLGQVAGVPSFMLASRSAWQPLADLAADVLSQAQSITRDVAIADTQGALRQLHVKTQLAYHTVDEAPHETAANAQLCVIFMEDLREIQARVRTEKLASMGRMSAAVAHEIRNPLSAIAQANALLSEEIDNPQQQRLVQMVEQNVQRLSRVVDDVLDVSRVEGQRDSYTALHQPASVVQRQCQEWQQQQQAQKVLLLSISADLPSICFEVEHLRRIIVNLLDNAKRHASGVEQSIQVHLSLTADRWVRLEVWSDGAPLEQGVQRHLFEPFFSSQSRSSGLGLFICRELCARHGASIAYQRANRLQMNQSKEGNEFYVLFALSFDVTQPMPASSVRSESTIVV
jgi:two-component system, NtrC family, sensor histidine kinase PilS